MKMENNEPKTIGRTQLKAAVDTLLQAELEGAEDLAPVAHSWAKEKIYQIRKMILKHSDNKKIVEDASIEASAAAKKLLNIVRRSKKETQEAIKNFVNEGGLPL